MSDKRPKSQLIILVAAVALFAGLVGGFFMGTGSSGPSPDLESQEIATAQLYSCGMHPDIISEEPGNCPICGMKLTPIKSAVSATTKPEGERKIKYWRAPMDPTYISDEPGKSPMGMDLVPVYEDEIAEGAISIDPVTVQNMGLRTAPVRTGELRESSTSSTPRSPAG